MIRFYSNFSSLCSSSATVITARRGIQILNLEIWNSCYFFNSVFNLTFFMLIIWFVIKKKSVLVVGYNMYVWNSNIFISGLSLLDHTVLLEQIFHLKISFRHAFMTSFKGAFGKFLVMFSGFLFIFFINLQWKKFADGKKQNKD